jgi:hypothetical protein
VGRYNSQRSLASTPFLISAACLAASCGSFSAADQSGAADGGGGTIDGSVDGGSTSPDGAPGVDAAVPVAPCNKPTPFATVPFVFKATTQLESARLGIDGVLYVTREILGKKQLGTTKFTDGGVDSTITPFHEDPAANDEQAMLSTDGLALVFQSDRAAGGPARLWVTARGNIGDAFLSDKQVPIVGAPADDPTTELQDPWVTPTRVYFTASPPGAGRRLQVADVDTASRTLKNARDVFPDPFEATNADHPVLSGDELELFYTDGNGKLARATRPAVGTPFPPGVVVNELAGTPAKPTWISPDDCDLYYFTSAGLQRSSRR